MSYEESFPNRTWPNHALQRTAPCVTAPASTAALPPTMQVPRRTPLSLSLGSLGDSSRLPKMKPKITYVLFLAVIFCGGAAFALFQSRSAETPLSYWQRQAAKVYLGMTRDEAEKVLPTENFDGVLWRLERMRRLYAPRLPKIRNGLEYHLIHSDYENLHGYEVAKGVFVTIRYNLGGLVPGSRIPAGVVVNPGDRVIAAPLVTATATGMRLFQ